VEKKQRERVKEKLEREGQVFKPIVLENPKRYQCPECETVSGTSLELHHYFNCPNKFKEAVE
jgi:hypothetical protein